jgi:hypothetical protein
VAAALLVVLAWALRRREQPLVLAVGFFAASYAVVANLLTPIGVLVAERLMYLPSVGYCLGLAWLWRCAERAPRAGARVAASGVLAVALVLFATRTLVRNRDWRDETTLHAATVRASPASQLAHYNHAAMLLMQPGHEREALEHLLVSRDLVPSHAPTRINLAVVYLRLGEPGKALATVDDVLRVAPPMPQGQRDILERLRGEAERRLAAGG